MMEQWSDETSRQHFSHGHRTIRRRPSGSLNNCCRWCWRLLLMALLIKPSATNPVGSPSGLQQRFSRAHFEFSLALYSALAAESPPNGDGEAVNLVFSPYSVSTVLAMIFLGAGAGSNTSLQLRSALHLNNFSFSEVHTSFKMVLANLADPYYAEALSAANGIFHQQSAFYVSDKYRRALDEFYSAEMHPADFASDPLTAMDQINAWCHNVTDGRISRLMRRPLDPSTKLVLVNGLTFRSQWLYRFDPTMTFDKGLFYTTSKKRWPPSTRPVTSPN